ncbi:ABC transporter permease [Pseudonocardia sp. HH130630-07]|uniref:ABC transporter permease n=1 Tax=Pseudonocardia sp. HH130630-07 TaxID=1690815 RepID=UPI0008153165|nr:ABC transporter permease [Pseudonocardia sp. HH130630-07]ANY08385.1 ABC transporter permease [Pseudonocardia sp. HH130630-07]
MLRYVLRRGVGWLAMIVVATNLTYFLANAFLDPRVNYLQLRPPRTDEEIARSLGQYNLDSNVALSERWWTWLAGIVTRWDWGASPIGDSVNTQVAFRVGVSGQLILASLVLSILLGVALGVYSASRQYRVGDRVAQMTSVFTLNTPPAVAALAVVFVAIAINQGVGGTLFYVAGAETPGIEGFWPTLLDRAQHLILPTISLLIITYAGYHMLQRAMLLDVVNSDYVRTARAKGLTRRQAIRRHGLRGSLIPVATQVAFAIPALFTGAVITEKVFAWQGMGDYLIRTISTNDIHGAVAAAAFAGAATAVGAILADIAVVALDPRVRVN